jgi:hypothetical protein
MANQPVPEQEKLAASMDRRSVAAQQQLDELNRVVNSKDVAAEITELLHGRVGLSEVKGGDIGVDAQGRTVVQPGTEEGGDKVTSRYGYKYDVSDSQRQVLNFILSDRAPTGTRWTERNEEGRAIPPRKLSDEDKAFVAQQHGVMAGKIAEIRQSGLHPSPEQLADIQQHVDVIQATTGKRFTYERAGKSQPTVGEDGVVRYPGVGDSQQFWNELLKRSGATGRAELSKQSKPDDATIEKIRQRLIHEAALSKTIASTIRKGLPSDHVENPAAPAKVPQNAVAPATKSIELSPEMVANKYGLQYRGEVSPGTQVHDFRHPDGGSFALRASELGNDEFIQAKLAKRAQEIKPEELHPVAAAKAAPSEPAPTKTVTVKRYDEAGNLMAEAPMRVPATLPTKELTAGEAHEELQAANRHLANLENKGLGQSKAAARVRQTIDQLQRVAPQSAEDTAHLQNIASSAIRTVERAERQNAPKTFMEPINRVAEGKGDAILALLGSTAGEEVPAKWLGDILKLHDATVPEDRDFLAYTAIQAAQKAGIEDAKFLAKRYGGALEALYRGLRKGDGPAALQAATRWAETGKLGVAIPKKGQEGFVVIPPFIPHILNELGKYASNAAVTTKDVLDWAQRWAELGSYRDVSEQSKNAMYKFRGELNRVEDLGRIAFNEGLNVYRHLPDQTGIDAMTRWRKGLPLHTPDAEGQRQIMQQLLDKAYVEAHTYRPSLNFLTDYLGSIWKKPPTNSAVLHEKSAQVINDAMLSGDKGMLRKRVFETVEDGIAAGGVPATTNPFEMALLSWGRLQQYIHVNKTLLPEIKMQGRLAHGGQELEALKNAGTLTDPVRVPDNIVSSWFARPTATGGVEVLKGQPYYMQRGELEMLKNHVSRDFVRQNVVGKTILDLKNIYTPIELFGPFHAMGIVAKSMAMGVNRGVNQAVNAGMMQGNLSEAVAGLGQLFKGLAEPYLAYKNGRALREAGGQTIIGWQKYQYSLQNFLATPQGKRLSAAIPNIEDTVEAMLQAGVRFDQNPLYATKWRESFLKNNYNVLQAFRQHNYLEGAARGTVGNAALGPLALLETFTSPLFQRAIPAIKLFATAKEINVELKRNAPMIQSGEISKEKVLQTAARRVDDTLGELNFDNLNASKGFKSALAMVVRSPGWRVGIMNIMKNAAYNQAADFVGSVKNRRAPSLDPDFSLLMTMLGGMTALVGAVIMQVFAHKAPTSPLDFQAPQIGGLDSRGKPNRVDPPLYNRDVRTFFGDASVGHPKDIPFELLKGTTSYLVGGQTGFITKGVEAAKNRTFEGGMVTDRSGFSGLFDRAVHTIAPVPFSVTGYQKMKSQGIPTGKALWLSGLALNPSARDLDMTEAEKVLSTADRRATYNFDARELTKRHLTQAIEGAIRSQQSEQLPDLQKQALTPDANGKSYLSFSDVKKAFENANKPYIVRMAEGSSVRPKDLVKAYMVATPEEQALILPYVWRAIRKDPEQFKVFSKYQQSRPKGIEGMN